MRRNEKRMLTGFSILDGIYWAFYASFVGFITTYMLACGMNNSELSFVLSIFMLTSFIGAFFWGSRCDKAKTNRLVFLPQFGAAFVVGLIIFIAAKRHLTVAAVLYPVFGFLSSSLGSNLDAWMLRSFDRDAEKYGHARAIGSMGYAMMALVMGQLIKWFGYSMIPAGMIFTAAVVIVFAFIMPEKPYESGSEHLKPSNPLKLFKPGSYLFMLIVIFLTGLAISPINNLKIVFLQSVGGDVGILGIDSFLGVMVQAMFIFISGRLRRISTKYRLFTVAVSVLAAITLVFFAENSAMIILSTVINNLSYGVMLPTMREITEKSVEGDLKNTAHSLCDAMFGSFAGVIALLYSGVMIDALGTKAVALLGIIIMLVPTSMTLYKCIRKN